MIHRSATGLQDRTIRGLVFVTEHAKNYNADARRAAARSGAAMPDGSFPIYSQTDAQKAWDLRNSSNHPADSVVAHIRSRVKALGLSMPA